MASILSRPQCVNSLVPGKFEWNIRYVIFKQISVIDGWGISCEIALIWTSLDFTADQSTLVQVMAWCRQAPSHYLSQCWPRSLLPYGVTRPQWVKATTPLNYLPISNDDNFCPSISSSYLLSRFFSCNWKKTLRIVCCECNDLFQCCINPWCAEFLYYNMIYYFSIIIRWCKYLKQYHGYSCPGSLHCQGISSHGVLFVSISDKFHCNFL